MEDTTSGEAATAAKYREKKCPACFQMIECDRKGKISYHFAEVDDEPHRKLINGDRSLDGLARKEDSVKNGSEFVSARKVNHQNYQEQRLANIRGRGRGRGGQQYGGMRGYYGGFRGGYRGAWQPNPPNFSYHNHAPFPPVPPAPAPAPAPQPVVKPEKQAAEQQTPEDLKSGKPMSFSVVINGRNYLFNTSDSVTRSGTKVVTSAGCFTFWHGKGDVTIQPSEWEQLFGAQLPLKSFGARMGRKGFVISGKVAGNYVVGPGNPTIESGVCYGLSSQGGVHLVEGGPPTLLHGKSFADAKWSSSMPLYDDLEQVVGFTTDVPNVYIYVDKDGPIKLWGYSFKSGIRTVQKSAPKSLPVLTDKSAPRSLPIINKSVDHDQLRPTTAAHSGVKFMRGTTFVGNGVVVRTPSGKFVLTNYHVYQLADSFVTTQDTYGRSSWDIRKKDAKHDLVVISYAGAAPSSPMGVYDPSVDLEMRGYHPRSGRTVHQLWKKSGSSYTATLEGGQSGSPLFSGDRVVGLASNEDETNGVVGFVSFGTRGFESPDMHKSGGAVPRCVPSLLLLLCAGMQVHAHPAHVSPAQANVSTPTPGNSTTTLHSSETLTILPRLSQTQITSSASLGPLAGSSITRVAVTSVGGFSPLVPTPVGTAQTSTGVRASTPRGSTITVSVGTASVFPADLTGSISGSVVPRSSGASRAGKSSVPGLSSSHSDGSCPGACNFSFCVNVSCDVCLSACAIVNSILNTSIATVNNTNVNASADPVRGFSADPDVPEYISEPRRACAIDDPGLCNCYVLSRCPPGWDYDNVTGLCFKCGAVIHGDTFNIEIEQPEQKHTEWTIYLPLFSLPFIIAFVAYTCHSYRRGGISFMQAAIILSLATACFGGVNPEYEHVGWIYIHSHTDYYRFFWQNFFSCRHWNPNQDEVKVAYDIGGSYEFRNGLFGRVNVEISKDTPHAKLNGAGLCEIKPDGTLKSFKFNVKARHLGNYLYISENEWGVQIFKAVQHSCNGDCGFVADDGKCHFSRFLLKVGRRKHDPCFSRCDEFGDYVIYRFTPPGYTDGTLCVRQRYIQSTGWVLVEAAVRGKFYELYQRVSGDVGPPYIVYFEGDQIPLYSLPCLPTKMKGGELFFPPHCVSSTATDQVGGYPDFADTRVEVVLDKTFLTNKPMSACDLVDGKFRCVIFPPASVKNSTTRCITTPIKHLTCGRFPFLHFECRPASEGFVTVRVGSDTHVVPCTRTRCHTTFRVSQCYQHLDGATVTKVNSTVSVADSGGYPFGSTGAHLGCDGCLPAGTHTHSLSLPSFSGALDFFTKNPLVTSGFMIAVVVLIIFCICFCIKTLGPVISNKSARSVRYRRFDVHEYSGVILGDLYFFTNGSNCTSAWRVGNNWVVCSQSPDEHVPVFPNFSVIVRFINKFRASTYVFVPSMTSVITGRRTTRPDGARGDQIVLDESRDGHSPAKILGMLTAMYAGRIAHTEAYLPPSVGPKVQRREAWGRSKRRGPRAPNALNDLNHMTRR